MSHTQQPLGTIISSVLNYDQLCDSIRESSSINNSTSSYVPCDGRSIVGSSLEKLTQQGPKQPDPAAHMKKAPDVRGRFLRGLNQIYSVGEPAFNIAEGDSQGQRTVGVYQPDELKAHTHVYSMWNFGFNSSNDGGLGHNEVDVLPDQARSSQSTGGAETRPKNVAVYFYLKIN